MTGNTTRSKRFLQTSRTKGFTLLELLVSVAVGGLVLSMAFSITISNRRLLTNDEMRTSLNQNLRSGADIVGADVRVTGQRLKGSPPPFMPVEIANNVLTLRRNLSDIVMTLCETNLSGGGDNEINVSYQNAPTHAGCQHDVSKRDAWESIRTNAEQGGKVKAYIRNISGSGEFFTYIGSDLSTSGMRGFRLLREPEPDGWANAYTATPDDAGKDPTLEPSIYLLEEHRYALDSDVLKLYRNGDNVGVGIINDVAAFRVSAVMDDGSTVTTLSNPADWQRIRAIEVIIVGRTTVGGRTVERTLTSRFFPRNILSK